MEFLHEPDIQGAAIEAVENGVSMGAVSYFIDEEGRMVIDHVVVDPQFRGRNIGRMLVDEAVRYARENDYRIVPWCTYAQAVFKRDSSMRDVLADV